MPPGTIFTGTPVLLFGEEDRSIGLTRDGGALNLPISFDSAETAETIRLLQGSRLITDWESRYPSEEVDLTALEKRKHTRVAQHLRQLSQTYGLASREMSLVAVVKRAGDQPSELPETLVVPVGMPQDTAFAAYFRTIQPRLSLSSSIGEFSLRHKLPRVEVNAHVAFYSPAAPSVDENLLTLCLALDPDGGMPGDTPEDRAAASIAALFAFLEHGHTSSSGAFREHVTRLIAFLEFVSGLRPDRQDMVAAALASVRKGEALGEGWLRIASRRAKPWAVIEKALRASLTPTSS